MDKALAALGLQRRVVGAAPFLSSAFYTVARSDLVLGTPSLYASRFAHQYGVAVYPMPFAISGLEISMAMLRSRRDEPLMQWLCARLRGLGAALQREVDQAVAAAATA